MSKDLLATLEKRSFCDEAIMQIIERDYPVGRAIRWQQTYQGTVYNGTVTMHGYMDRIQVRNSRTGAVYWITAGKVRR